MIKNQGDDSIFLRNILKKNRTVPLIFLIGLFLFTGNIYAQVKSAIDGSTSLTINPEQSRRIDILVFSPHPDDETLACGGTILKAIQENKKVKVVFLTNGDAYVAAASAWFKKKAEELTPEDFIGLGEERRKEALAAIKDLSLKGEDVIFLSYPDARLLSLWRQNEDKTSQVFIKSKTTKTERSPYEKTYGYARIGYSRNNLLSDIKNILKEYQPKRIYTPYPQDTHKDHQATTLFVNLALEELIKNGRNKWIDSSEVTYYLIHSSVDEFTPSSWPAQGDPSLNAPFYFSQQAIRNENISDFKNQKIIALGRYHTQLNIEAERNLLGRFIKDNELFWDIPADKISYLRQFEKEWGKIGEILKEKGYHINFAPVVDVASDIENPNIHLLRKQRVYSQDPRVVMGLVSAVIRGMGGKGIIPVIKHFPGLGSVYSDTHRSLPRITISKNELYKRDIFPFKKLIKKYPDIWVMVDHAIYPSLSNRPASLSYEIQTKLLRKEMGFKGIIVADELAGMEAIKEYAAKQGIKEPYVPEIVLMAFQAGADMVILYPYFEGREEIISCIIERIKQAINKGMLKREFFDVSVRRILKEKEKMFGMPLEYLINKMSLEEKICQKLIFDRYTDIEIFKKYDLGGMYLREPDYEVVKEIQKKVKIPIFIIGQHEGGLVSQSGIVTRSAYLAGKEFERTVVKAGEKIRPLPLARHPISLNELETKQPAGFERLGKAAQDKIIYSLIDCLDELIALWSMPGPHLNYFSPLIYTNEGTFEIKSFNDVPMSWVRRFPNSEIAYSAYCLFKKIFEEWPDNQKISIKNDVIIAQLTAFKKEIEEAKSRAENDAIRILCLATHPDDEDGEALLYLGKKFHCETHILLATRGEGGENKIGNALYEELGFLRTEEMEKAASILGVKKVYYLGKNDFGYCSSPEEAIETWGKEDTLKKLIYFYRLIRPHIIITKHNKFDMHCQHRALITLAEEAFDLAGNPNIYPEMISQGLLSWQPLKFYQRAKEFDPPIDNVFVGTRENIASENKTYHQVAIEALSQHRSQGDWHWLNPGNSDKFFYQLVKSKVPLQKETSFFDGINSER